MFRLTSQIIVLSVSLALAIAVLGPAAAHAAPGDLDESFAGDGVTEAPIPGDPQTSEPSVAVGPDREVVVAGGFAVMRYSDSGEIDSGFAGDGTASLDAKADDVAVQPDGAIVVAQSFFESAARVGLRIVRMLPDGTPDPSFGGDGSVEISVTPADQFALPPQIQLTPQGRIVATSGQTVVRLLPDGSLDPSFSGDGKENLSVALADAAVGPDGSLVLVGEALDFPTNLYVISLTADGGRDTSFGTEGVVDLQIGNYGGGGYSVVLDPAGRIVVGGGTRQGGFSKGESPGDFVIRFTPTGQLDPSFSADGSYSTATSPVAVQNDGKILFAGARQHFEAPTFALSRFDSSGSLDPPYGRFGIAGVFFGFEEGDTSDLALAPDGKPVVAGIHGGNTVVTRFELAPGFPDADADGLRDRHDLCPFRYADSPSGCPVAQRWLTGSSTGGHVVQGELEAVIRPCKSGERIKLVETRPGRNRVVKVVETEGGDDAGAWHARVSIGLEHLVAVAPGHVIKGDGRCATVRSGHVESG